MKKMLYQKSMRYSSMILFVFFILAILTGFVSLFLNYAQTMDFLSDNILMDGYWSLMPGFAVRAFVEALLSAALLFLGSALLYRVDKWLEAAE